MEENEIEFPDLLKEKLITAAIDEICAVGSTDFSLRKIAASCGASCAAPYKHFKNKEGFMAAISGYIENKKELLRERICDIHKDDIRTLVIKLAVAEVRMSLSFPAVTVPGENRHGDYTLLRRKISEYLDTRGTADAEKREQAVFGITVAVAGVSSMIASGRLDNGEGTFRMLESAVCDCLDGCEI